jgi:uncharacterized protein YifN (PemK superfamily)
LKSSDYQDDLDFITLQFPFNSYPKQISILRPGLSAYHIVLGDDHINDYMIDDNIVVRINRSILNHWQNIVLLTTQQTSNYIDGDFYG